MDISDQKKIVQILLLLFVYIFKHCLLMFSRKQRFFFFYRRDGGDIVCPSMPTMKSYEACRNAWL